MSAPAQEDHHGESLHLVGGTRDGELYEVLAGWPVPDAIQLVPESGGFRERYVVNHALGIAEWDGVR